MSYFIDLPRSLTFAASLVIKGSAIIGKGNAVITEMLLEPLDVVRAEGDMAAFTRVDMSAVSRRDVQIPFGKMHLHAAFRGEFDLTVVAYVPSGVCAWEILRRDRVHPQDIDIEIMQGVDIF